ncbi:MAG: hypothetical protein ACQETR_10310 [Thermodesulfobacteriota bacterium]
MEYQKKAFGVFIGGAVTCATIGYWAFNPTPALSPENYHNLTAQDPGIIRSIIDSHTYKAFNQVDILDREVEIVHSFVNKMVENSEPTPQEFSKLIDENFWDLA